MPCQGAPGMDTDLRGADVNEKCAAEAALSRGLNWHSEEPGASRHSFSQPIIQDIAERCLRTSESIISVQADL